MKNNLELWAKHYEDILLKYYHDFCKLIINNKDKKDIIPEYKEFVIFIYSNTKKSILGNPGMFNKELRAPIL